MNRKITSVILMATAAAALAGCSSGAAAPTPTVTATKTATATVETTVTATPVITKVVKTKTATVTETYQPTYDKYGDGTYVVGQDIKPGRYFTTGSGSLCYFARLSSLNSTDIVENGNPTGPTTVEIQSGDKAFQVRGDCTFGPR